MSPLSSWSESFLREGSQQAEVWVAQYGFHAVAPTLLADPAGVPWAWIFLILFAGAAKLHVPAMLLYGFLVLSAFDHVLYWIGLKGGRPLVEKIGRRFPKIADALHKAEDAMRGRGIWMITLGRYLPLVGRWVGAGAGLANVSYVRFALFDALGVGLTVIGFGLPAHLIGQEIMDESWFPQAIGATFLASTFVTVLIVVWGGVRAKRNQTA